MPSSTDPLFWWYEEPFPPSVRQGLLVRRLHEESSELQRIEVLENEALGRVLVLDGIVQTAERDEFVYHEMLVHVPLASRTAAQRGSVVVLGGGDGGALREVLSYEDVESAMLVEIDRSVIEVSRRWIPLLDDWSDPRIDLQISDAARWLRDAGDESFDAVILDAPDPVGPGEVLYDLAFIQDVHRCLKSDGVFARHLGVPTYQEPVLAVGAARIREIFGCCELYRAAVPTYVGGDLAFAVARKDRQPCNTPVQRLSFRHYNSSVHVAAFALPSWWNTLSTSSS